MRRAVVNEDVHATLYSDLKWRRETDGAAEAGATLAPDEHRLTAFHGGESCIGGRPDRQIGAPCGVRSAREEWQTMGMRAHLTAIDQSLVEGLSDDQVYSLLSCPEAAGIDKSWEAAFPLVGSIAGTGMMLVDDPLPISGDLGFGPAMFVEPGQVKAIAERLARADDAMIESHWAALESPFMQPGMYDDDWGKQFAMDGYRQIVQVFTTAAAASQGVLFAIM